MFVHPLLKADVSAINGDLNNQKENENGDRTSKTGSEGCAELSYMDSPFALLDEQERNDFLRWTPRLAALISSLLLRQAAAALLSFHGALQVFFSNSTEAGW